MFEDLNDAISLRLFWWTWPIIEAEVTAVDLQRLYDRHRRPIYRLIVVYKFSVGDDGPYTGQSPWSSETDETYVLDIADKLRVGARINVRYRKSNPTVNTMDRRFLDSIS